MPSPLAQLRAVSPAPAHPPSASVARVVTWTEFPAKNCWWGGHGAEEVDTPRGSAVSGVKTIDACKAACLDKTQCDGVLFQKSSGKCFRKARLQPRLCRPDDTLTLFVLQDPNRPPAPPFAPSLGSFASPAKCSAALRDPNHKFYKMWSADNGFTDRARGEKACWDVPWADSWFDFVGDATNCDQDWDWTGNNMPDAPTVFGFSETMAAYCHDMAGRRGGGGDPGHACRNAHINILRIGSWTMCRNTEWMMCVLQRKVGSAQGEIVFSLAPGGLEMDVFMMDPDNFAENDVYFLEVCILSEVCSNNQELFAADVGALFVCKFDRSRWDALARAMAGM